MGVRIAVVSLLLLVACAKKDDAPRADGARGREGGGVGVVNGGLASADGGALQTAKSSLVAQQCALACGVKPENDPGLCTQTCVKACINEKDVAGIDACAKRVATP